MLVSMKDTRREPHLGKEQASSQVPVMLPMPLSKVSKAREWGV